MLIDQNSFRPCDQFSFLTSQAPSSLSHICACEQAHREGSIIETNESIFWEDMGKNINRDIANLVKAELPVHIQKALDIVRVIQYCMITPFPSSPALGITVFVSVQYMANKAYEALTANYSPVKISQEKFNNSQKSPGSVFVSQNE